MNPLSILNTAARASGLKDEGFVSRDDAAQDDTGAQRSSFASMLNNPAQQQANSTQQASRSQPAKRETAKPRQDDDSQKHDDDGTRAQGQDERQARAQRSEAGSRKDSPQRPQNDAAESAEQSTASAEAGEKTESTGSEPGTWPPPGLGGFGLMLLQPTATTATPDAAALGGTAANPLLAGQPQADAAAAMPNALPAGAIALPGLAGAANAATAATAASADDAAALAALAAATLAAGGASAAGSDGDSPAIDTPTFVLPTLPHTTTAGARVQDTPAVFSASPTPTPDLNGDGFDDAVGTRLTWLAEQKIGHAHIKITPNDLGPVEVRLQMDGDKVHASFTASHVETRQALEQSLPRLRDMLGEHGFQLAHADVGAQQQGQRNDGSASSSGFDGLADGASEDTASVVVPASVLRARGLLDAYA
ncbi:flagellar hook-length control protein FliK [Stenotrophomonas panacihumi]|uniref:flagellar hook-length control protein FliK n=1 Tax=Stenotrophomonas panacihumi TaxID=676599 RepID=UPI000AA9DE29|nr:flagellar hook-length control protein FliK [Stenotrophomonas panacihumi]